MNARGETAGRLCLALLAGEIGNIILGEDHTWPQAFGVMVIFFLGYAFAKAPSISDWIEGEHDEGRDNARPRQSND